MSGEVTAAAHIDDVFWQVQAVIAANPAIDHSEVFHDWLGDTYVDSMVIRLRRLVDTSTHVISLWRLLEKIKVTHVRFTRAWFRQLWSSELQDLADQRFDMLAGPGARFMSRDRVAFKQRELTDAIRRIEDFANDHVAHRVLNPTVPATSFGDLRESLAVAFSIFNWCALLIEASTWTSAVPEIQSNWTAVFRQAWLPDGQLLPTYKHLDDVGNPTG